MKHKQTEREEQGANRKPNTTKYVNMPFISATWRQSVLLPQQISTYKFDFLPADYNSTIPSVLCMLPARIATTLDQVFLQR